MNPEPEGAKEPGDYQSYLLRLWRVSDDEGSTWRATLRSSRTGEQVGFGSLEDLFDFLRSQTCLTPNGAERAGRRYRSYLPEGGETSQQSDKLWSG